MTSRSFLNIFIALYLVIFFGYLFGPLILMSLSAFNSSPFPRVAPWDCFTFEWFEVLVNDKALVAGFWNSIIIGIGVVFLSVTIGLAGAMVLTRVRPGIRPVYYTIVISPILVPGVVLGISTLIFWDRLGVMFNADYDSIFYNGIALTILGQSTFISAYCMLVFIARLQRFDTVQEEAALDLGATHVQTFRKILLPFLKPAIGSAAVLAFLASFENYNTTIFTIVSESTLTTVLASKVRYGINPSISALAVIIVVVTLLGALVHEALQRREKLKLQHGELGDANKTDQALANFLSGNPAMLGLILVFVAGLGTVWFASQYSPRACKQQVFDDKQRRQQFKGPKVFERKTSPVPPVIPSLTKPGAVAPSKPKASPFGNVFNPGNLEDLTKAK